MTRRVRGTSHQLDGVEISLLRRISPFSIQDDQRGERVWIGSFQYPGSRRLLSGLPTKYKVGIYILLLDDLLWQLVEGG